ncbi:MAG: DUF948 domain-containing protein [Coriobacteriia bacterium]|nr:DUF948 domain-containing protein [Coriobacteriia bacterium]
MNDEIYRMVQFGSGVMVNEGILRMILLGSGAVLIVVVIYAVIELIRTLRWVRYTAEDLQPSIKQATEVLEALEPTVKKANEILESLEPSMQRVDPLLERISLTVDAVNLEIMRADQILANLTDVTDVASSAAKKVNVITDTPLNLLTSATDKVRNIFSDRKPESDTIAALDQVGTDSQVASLTQGDTSAVSSPTADSPSSFIESVVSEDTSPFSVLPDLESPDITFNAPTMSTPVASDLVSPEAPQVPVSDITEKETLNAAIATDVDIATAASDAALAAAAQAAAITAEEMVPPYQDDIELVEPESEKPQWPF